MSTAENIVIPPVQNKEAAVIRRETTQTNIGYFMRKVVRDTLAKTNDTLQDAAIEIAIGRTLYDNPGGFRMMSYGRIKGLSQEDLKAYQITIKKRYEAWHGALKDRNEVILLVKEICQDEKSIDFVRKEFKISEKTAFQWLQEGLNEYALIAGWGNQIEGNIR